MKNRSFFKYFLSKLIYYGVDLLRLSFEKIGVNSILAKFNRLELNNKWRIILFSSYFLALINMYLTLFPVAGIQLKLAFITELVLVGSFAIICIKEPINGLYLFALSLPIITYRPLLAFILIIALTLLIVRLDYEVVKKNLNNHLNFAALLFIIVTFITAITSVNWRESVTHFFLYYFVSFSLYLLLVILISKKEILFRFIGCLIISAAFTSIYGIFQYLTLDATSSQWIDVANNPGITKRIFGTFGNPNIFSQYLNMIIPFSFVYIFYVKSWRMKMIYSGAFLLICSSLVLTFSRGGWLATAISLFILATLISRRLLVLGLIGSAIGANFLPVSIINRISTIFHPAADSSSAYRFKMWESAIPIIKEYWLTGIGSDPTTFFKVYADYMMPDVRIFHFHNIYIMAIVTGGILLLGALLYLFYIVIRTSVVSLFVNSGKDKFLSYIAKAALASFIAIAIAGLTEDIWRQYRVDFLFWIVVAINSIVYNLANREASKENS